MRRVVSCIVAVVRWYVGLKSWIELDVQMAIGDTMVRSCRYIHHVTADRRLYIATNRLVKAAIRQPSASTQMSIQRST